MMRALPVLLLVACGPKLDPLHPMKAELAQARRSPGEGEPHAVVAIAESTLTDLVTEAFAEPITVPVMMGTAASVKPDLQRPTLSIVESAQCDCPRFEIGATGEVDIDLAGLLGRQKLADDLGFQARASGAARFTLAPTEDGGQTVFLAPVRREPWSIDVTLAESKGLVTDKLVRNQVTAPLEQQLAQPLAIATIPPTVPLRAAKIAFQVADDPTIAFWAQARPPKRAPKTPTPERGWALVITEDGLLASTRASMAALVQHPRWKIEPRGLQVDDGRWTAQIRLHKVARRAKYRDYTVDGTFVLGEEGVEIFGTSALRTDKAGWGLSVVSLFADGRVRKTVEELTLDVPSSMPIQLGKTHLRLELTSVESPGKQVRLAGEVLIAEPPDAP